RQRLEGDGHSQSEEQSDRMESVMHFVDDVARRLQLLALNGNIIAAQAGEHGRAFRVVCRELGSLADQSKNTGNEVRKLIQAMGLERSETEFMNRLDTLSDEHGPDATARPEPS